jgi:hypothetical protein
MCKAPSMPKQAPVEAAPPPPPPNPTAARVQTAPSAGGGSEVEYALARRSGKSMLKIPSMSSTGISY